jgi:ribonuclease P protein component
MDRMKRRADFLAAATGARASMPAFLVQARDRKDSAASRIGFTVTKKTGSAVERNRIRRRLRAAARTVVPSVGYQGFDYVLVARRPALRAPFAALVADLENAMIRLHRPARRRDGGAHE